MATTRRPVSVFSPKGGPFFSRGLRRDLQAVVDSNRITLNMRNQVNKAVRKSTTKKREFNT